MMPQPTQVWLVVEAIDMRSILARYPLLRPRITHAWASQ